jgi:hypothetical protein
MSQRVVNYTTAEDGIDLSISLDKDLFNDLDELRLR